MMRLTRGFVQSSLYWRAIGTGRNVGQAKMSMGSVVITCSMNCM